MAFKPYQFHFLYFIIIVSIPNKTNVPKIWAYYMKVVFYFTIYWCFSCYDYHRVAFGGVYLILDCVIYTVDTHLINFQTKVNYESEGDCHLPKTIASNFQIRQMEGKGQVSTCTSIQTFHLVLISKLEISILPIRPEHYVTFWF